MRFTVLTVLLLFLVVSTACDRGNNKLMVGSIKGPTEIAENSSAEYKIDAHSDTGITYSWISNPVGTGTFSSTDTPSVIFTAPEVETDFPIVIRVVVNSDNDGPVIRSLDVLIVDGGDPPIAAASFEKDIVAGWHNFQIKDESTDKDSNEIIKWEWDFSYDENDGLIVESEEQNPLVKLCYKGIYQVMLRVTDSTGSVDMLNEPLLLEVEYLAFYVPLEPGPYAEIIELAVDNNDDIYVIGEGEHFRNYLAKYTKGESLLWMVEFIHVTILDMAIDDNGYIFICGFTRGEADLDPGAGEFISRSDAFVAQFDQNGNFLTATIEWAPHSSDHPYEREITQVETTQGGNLVIVESIHEYDGYWAYDPFAGMEIWHETYSEYYYSFIKLNSTLDIEDQIGTLIHTPVDIAVSESGSIYILCQGTLEKYNEEYESLWITDTLNHYSAIVVDSNDNAYTTGSGGSKVAKYNGDGDCIWYRNLDQRSYYGSSDIVLVEDSLIISGILIFVYGAGEQVDMDPGVGEQIHNLDFDKNSHVSIFNLDGVFEDSLVWGGEFKNHSSITVDSNGNVLMGLSMDEYVDLDPGAGSIIVDIRLKWNVQYPSYYYYPYLMTIFPF